MPRSNDISLGLVSGVLGGLAAAFAMNEFQSFWMALDKQAKEKAAQSKPATLKAADKASEALAGQSVPEPAQKIASNAVHYLTGAILGGAYGLIAEIAPGITAGAGMAYGGVAWIAMDEVLVPALDLGPRPAETPPKDHLYGVTSHIVFGLTLELVRDVVSDILAPRPLFHR